MQDAQFNAWSRQSQLPVEMRHSMRELNHRFLDLVASRPDGWRASRSGSFEVSARVAPLSAAQKAAVSNCPYALFDLRFHDDRYWQTRLEAGGHWSIAEDAADPQTLEFVKLAMFFAWHAASTTKLAAQLLLGMHDATAAAFRGATIDCLPALAASAAVHLSARWSDCGRYWSALTGAASGPNTAELRRIQLYGLQLAAAARLS